jgi:hypothetical protein
MAVTYPEANKSKVTNDVIKTAYDSKIAAYHMKLVTLENQRKALIKRATVGKSIDVNQFMRDAEKIGIDEMNHKAIIEMLIQQYQDWFGEKSEATTVYEEERASKLLEGEFL